MNESCAIWYGLKKPMITSQAVEGMWFCMCSCKWVSSKWVNQKSLKSFLPSFSPDLVVLCPKVDLLKKLGTLLNPFTPGNFAEKQVLS